MHPAPLTALIIALTVALLPPVPANAQEPPPPPPPVPAPPPEAAPGPAIRIEVTATRAAEPLETTPRAVSEVTARQALERGARSAPLALAEAPGVHVQQTEPNGGSPFIRGLTGQQTLLLIDGIRLNTAITRAGPNQYLGTIDPFSVGRYEVVRGPGSVLYGSDAIGGVVNVLTPDIPDLDDPAPGAGGAVLGRYASASRGVEGHADAYVKGHGFGLALGGTYSEFDDIRGGRRTGTQEATSYEQRSGDLKVAFQPPQDPRHVITGAFQHVDQLNADRTDREATGRDIEFERDPQNRDLAYGRYRFAEPDPDAAVIGAVEAWYAFQRQREDRFQREAGRQNIQRKNRDVVETNGFGAQVRTGEIARQVFTVGAEYYRDHVISRRVDVNLATGATTRQRGTFADGTIYQTLGVYVQDEVRIVEDRVVLLAGGRYTHIDIHGDFPDPTLGRVSISGTEDALVGSGHVRVTPVDGLHLLAGIAQGFRAPNADDLSILGPFSGGFEVPNPDLDPERSLSYEAGLRFGFDPPAAGPVDLVFLEGETFFHWTEIDDLIVRQPGTFLGQTFIDFDGDGVEDRGEAVFARKNASEATIYGIEAAARIRVTDGLSVFGTFQWTIGENRTDDEPLGKVPPTQGTAGIRYDFEVLENECFVEGVGVFARNQHRLNAADKADPRVPPGGTSGYEVYHLRGGARIRDHIDVLIAVENILDRDYRVHGSSFNGPGTQAVLTLRAFF